MKYFITEQIRQSTPQNLPQKLLQLKTPGYISCFTRHPVVVSILIISALFSGCATVSKPSVYRTDNVKTAKPAAATYELHPVVAIAEKLRDKPYLYGGITPKGFDCSGLVHYAYLKTGKTIPRTTWNQYRISQRLPFKNAKPGDLLFFKIDSRKLSHVGLYAGDGRFIHASTKQNRVMDASLNDAYWRTRLIGVGRIQ
ncbi:MAG: C40 family peptidase [Candidatus Thiodiazotropha sp.]